MAVNLVDSPDSSRYAGDVLVRQTTEQGRPYVYVATEGGGEFGYQYIGVTDSLVHILLTHDWGGGSGVFTDLVFLTI